MRQEQSELKAILTEEQRHITDDIKAISTYALSVGKEAKAAMSEEQEHITESMKAFVVNAGKHSTELKAILLKGRKQMTKDMEGIITAAGRTIAAQNQNLRSGVSESVSEVNRLRNQALQLGTELGQFDEIIESNRWLKGLRTLVKGDEEIEPDQVRVIGITVMQALLTWLDRHSQDSGVPFSLRSTVTNLISGFEKWKV
ncbi:hypothetical protein ACFLV5_00975 [Chloroflexota bacterium]